MPGWHKNSSWVVSVCVYANKLGDMVQVAAGSAEVAFLSHNAESYTEFHGLATGHYANNFTYYAFWYCHNFPPTMLKYAHFM